MTSYYRPVPRYDHCRPDTALPLAGGWLWFDTVEEIRRDAPSRLLPAAQVPPEALDRLTAPRASPGSISRARSSWASST